MKYAIVGGQRHEAQPGMRGNCLVCGAESIAKCGEKRIWHWAHKTKRKCDHWWENETEWHRNWKNQLPVEWQEIVQTADNGERHIADVKTDQGWVIEFQHSHLKPEERRSRESFYGNLVWVVDGLRRKRDLKQFVEAVRNGTQLSESPLIVTVHRSGSRLVEEWSTSPAPVFFDFGGSIQPNGLWLLIPLGLGHTAYFALVGKENFVIWHRQGTFTPQPFIDGIKKYEQQRAHAREAHRMSQQARPWARRRSSRRL